jgi:hypothetical protein
MVASADLVAMMIELIWSLKEKVREDGANSLKDVVGTMVGRKKKEVGGSEARWILKTKVGQKGGDDSR